MRVWSGSGVWFLLLMMVACLPVRPAMAADGGSVRGVLPFASSWADQPNIASRSLNAPLVSSNEKAPPLERIFQTDMLGVQRAYLETITGPAKYIGKQSDKITAYTYMVQSCEVTAFGNGDVIDGYKLHVTPSCTLPLLPLDSQKGSAATLSDLTMGDVDTMLGGAGKPFGHCIAGNCGNSQGASLALIVRGAHVNDWINIAVSATDMGQDINISDKVDKAADAWIGAMNIFKSEDEKRDYVEDEKYNCNGDFDDAGRLAMKNLPVQYIFFGQIEPDISQGTTCP